MLTSVLTGLSLLTSFHPARKPPLGYRLTVDAADLSGYSVELTIRNAPAGVTLAAAAHPEYDDKYWRYIEGFQASDQSGAAISVTRDSVLWRLANRAGVVRVRYRLRLPMEPLPRAAWRPFLTATGGLVGGPHSFLYPLGMEREAVQVGLVIPSGWVVGSALEPSGANGYAAPNLASLMESPIQVGIQSKWSFAVQGVPHEVFYWRLPNAAPFDTAAFVSGIRKFAEQAIGLFGGAPYRRYAFLFQDGAFGGLEHPASVTLGAPSAGLARDPNASLAETAHEFFHTWNLMYFKPSEYRELEYTTQPPVAELWFSEGLTIFYADLLLRRAGLAPPQQPTRTGHLEVLMGRYLAGPGHSRFSAEAISRVAYNAGPGALGDYSGSAHLIGELLGGMFDFKIRAASRGERSMDDVMRVMNRRFGGKGFTSDDVRRASEEVCGCSMQEDFERHVTGANPIEFTRYLEPMGIRASVRWEPAADQTGKPLRDLRLFSYQRANEDTLRLLLTDPGTAWGKAGLHTHDVLVSLNGKSPKTRQELAGMLNALAMGDTVSLTVRHEGVERTVRVVLQGYDRPVVRLEPLASASPEQRRLFESWSRGQ